MVEEVLYVTNMEKAFAAAGPVRKEAYGSETPQVVSTILVTPRLALPTQLIEINAYSLEEETHMLAILPEPAATVVAMAAFTGARKGEIRGFRWENYDGFEIRVEKSVWRSHVEEPKRPKSKGAIPVIAQLRTLLN